MKKIKDYIGWALISVFIIGVMVVGYRLYFILTDDIKQLINIAEVEKQNEAIQSLVTEVTILTLSELIIGVITCVLLVIRKDSSSEENIVYVEKFVGDKKSESDNKAEAYDSSTSSARKERVLSDIERESEGKQTLKDRAAVMLSVMCKAMDFSTAAYYTVTEDKQSRHLTFVRGFAFHVPESESLSYEFGEGLAGQAALENRTLKVSNIPEGYITVRSGLGESSPKHLLVCPITDHTGKVVAVTETASLKEIPPETEDLIKEAALRISGVET